MAVFSLKSTVIANRDATPKIFTDAYVSGGELEESEGFVQTGSAADSVGSKYTLCQVPSNARVSSLILQNDAMGGAGALNIGVYYPTFIPVGAGLSAALAGTAINATLFASALSVVAAGGPTDEINQSGNNTIAKQELPLWAAAGLAADPGIQLDIAVAVSTVLAAQGYIGIKARYVKQ
jgi:hypothetical protein